MTNLRLLTLRLAVVALTSTLLAQTDPNLEQGLKPYGSYAGGAVDAVSLTNGNVTMQTPIYSLPQRGKLPLSFFLLYNNKQFTLSQTCTQAPRQCTYRYVFQGGGVQIGSSLDVAVQGQWVDSGIPDPNGAGGDLSELLYNAVSLDGSIHQLGSTTDGFRAVDGSGYVFRPSSLAPNTSGTLFDRSGNAFAVIAANQPNVPANPAPVADSNGNTISTNGSNLIDTLGRQVPLPTSVNNGNTAVCPNLNASFQPVTSATQWNLPGPNGGTLQMTLCWTFVKIHTNFWGSLSGNPSYQEAQYDPQMLQSVVFPNGTAWSFIYDAADPNNSASIGYGDLTRIIFPTGGSISYTWTTMSPCADGGSGFAASSRAVVSRVVNDTAATHEWDYAWDVAFTQNTQTGEITEQNVETLPTAADGTRNDVVHYVTGLGGSCSDYETQTQYYQGRQTGGTLLKTENAAFGYYLRNPLDPQGLTVSGVHPTQRIVTWPNGRSATVNLNYDGTSGNADFTYRDRLYSQNVEASQNLEGTGTVPYGVQTLEQEYDYSGALLRQTATAYQWQANSSYLTSNTLNLPSSVTVKDAAGNRCAETDYTYDEAAYLTGASIGTQHTAPPGPARGNLSTKTQWLGPLSETATSCALQSGGTWSTIASHTNWYDTGEVFKQFDPLSATQPAAQYAYDSAYAGAYPTTISNALGQSTTITYDPNTGLRTGETDANGQLTQYTYDNLFRLTDVLYPDLYPGSMLQGETSYAYHDSVPFGVTISSVLGPASTRQEEYDVDGLGRLIHAKLLTDPSGTVETDTAYDELGRKQSVTNPYRSTSDPTYGSTSYTYDALSRPLSVVHHPDNSSEAYSYIGAAVQVADEGNGSNNVTRISQSDALGRLISVCEVTSAAQQGSSGAPSACGLDIGGSGFLTSYQYDPLGNLLSVAQGPLTARSFAYDSLSRLLSAANPESGKTSYAYDANSNLVQRQRPAPNQTNPAVLATATYSYDGLNRLTQTSYSDQQSGNPFTPAVHLDYDSASNTHVPISGSTNLIGRKVDAYVNNSSGAMQAGEAFSYDPVGRVIASPQCTPQNCASNGTFGLNYGYDLDGHVLSSTNGAGVTFTYGYNNAGQMASMASSWKDAAHPSGLMGAALYTPAGALSSGNLGANLNESYSYDSRLRLSGEGVSGLSLSTAPADMASVSLSGALESKLITTQQAVAGSASLTMNGTEQSTQVLAQAATTAGGAVTINGGADQSVQVMTYAGAPGTGNFVVQGAEGSGRFWICNDTCVRGPLVYDSGSVSASVGGFIGSAGYGSSSTATSVATDLTSSLNRAGSPVYASQSGTTVYLTARSNGAATNYALSTSTSTNDPTDFPGGSFWTTLSGGNMTGGANPTYTTVYDSGTVSITVNGHANSASFNSGSSTSSIASALTAAINGDGGAPETAGVSGATVYLTSKATGAGANYALSSSWSWNTTYFGGSSFNASNSGGALTGGNNAVYNTVYDSGSVSVTVNGNFSKSAGYGQGTTNAGLATALASAINGDGTSPVTAGATGTTLRLTSKQAGIHTDYLFSTSDAYNTQYFSTPSFTLSPPVGSLQNGANSTVQTQYDAGTVSVTVGSMTKTASYGNASNASTEAVAGALASAFNGDGTSPVTASVAGSVINLQAKTPGSGSGLGLSASVTYDTGDFTQGSFTGTPSAATLAGGNGTVASPTTLYTMNVTQYAPDGNIVQLNDSVNGNWSYTYDGFNRLSTSNQSNQQAFTYGYDRFGNRWNQTATIGSGPQPNYSFTGNNNRMDGYLYDAAGNLLNDGTASYIYDDENRIVQIVGGASYLYDANGQRVRKVTGSGTFDYLFDLSGHQVAELTTAGALNRGEIYAGGRHLGTYSNNTTYFSHEDNLGTERVRSNANGTMYETCLNLPFGDGQSCSGGDPSPMHFTGKPRDTLSGETGLDYFGARYFSSTMGHWMSPDWADKPTAVPYSDFGNPQSLNLYGYVGNNPASHADVDGHDCPGCMALFPDASATAIKFAAEAVSNPRQAISDFGTGALKFISNAVNLIQSDHQLPASAEIPVQSPSNASQEAGMATAAAATVVVGEAAGASSEVNLADRAQEIHSALDPIAQNMRTTAVADVTDASGNQQFLVGSSRNTLAPAQRAVLNPNETPVSGAGHAEQTVLNAAAKNGQTVNAVGTSRTMCPTCRTAVEKAGAKIQEPH